MTRALRVLVLLAASLAAGLAVPSFAAGAEGYEQFATTCASGGGEYDEAGTFYLACGAQILVTALDGTERAPIALQAGATDVAPAPNGSMVYAVHPNQGGIRRYNRQPDGSWVLDTGWRVASFPMYGAQRTLYPRWIAADGHGNIYTTDIVYNTVVKYAPDGSFVTRFAEYHWGKDALDPASWNPGFVYWRIGGVDVSRDGHRVYFGEIGNNRVQRFDWQADGSYAFAGQFGNSPADDDPATPRYIENGVVKGDEARTPPGLTRPGLMSAPYDVGVDPWGYVYVTSTTWSHVQKFTGDGTHLWGGYATANPGTCCSHWIAVDGHGNVFNGETKRALRRTTPEPGPWPALEPLAPDTRAPKLISATAPASTVTTRIQIALEASDNRSVAGVQIATNGTWGAWQPYAATVQHQLPATAGSHALQVRVRDGAGNLSNVADVTVVLQLQVPEPAAPVAPAPAEPAGPRMTKLALPAHTAVRRISVRVRASGPARIVRIRIANENGRWGRWKRYRSRVGHTLSSGAMVKGVWVQVRDSRGRRSDLAWATTLCDPCVHRHTATAKRRARTLNARLGRYLRTGTDRRDRVRGTRRGEHFDFSQADGRRDLIDCRGGRDTVLKRREDRTRRCERVRVVRTPPR